MFVSIFEVCADVAPGTRAGIGRKGFIVGDNLQSKTKDELIEMARQKGVQVDENATKDQIVQQLQQHQGQPQR